MDDLVYDTLSHYFHALEVKGYMPFCDSAKVLLLIFYRDFVYNDYRANITEEDYHLIEKALNCLYGTTCLIPYPDYLKMGKLYLGQITELNMRVKEIENTPVIKLIHDLTHAEEDIDTDVMVATDQYVEGDAGGADGSTVMSDKDCDCGN